jgi:hypothetical protein
MSTLPNVQNNNEQILNDIQSLQQMEQQLFSNLESNTELTSQQQKQIIEKMNQLSDMRVNLYQTLSGVNSYFQNALNSSVGTLKEQSIAIGIVENELNKAKKRLKILEEEKNNKIRLVEINTYYSDKYEEHSHLMKILIFTFIPIIILSILFNKGFLPNKLYFLLLFIVIVVGGYYFVKRYTSIISRNNMNYQKYDWNFNSKDVKSPPSNAEDPWYTGDMNLGTCIGNACCSPGLVYDSEINQCVKSISIMPIKKNNVVKVKENMSSYDDSNMDDSLIHNILTKTQNGKYKEDINMKSPTSYNF